MDTLRYGRGEVVKTYVNPRTQVGIELPVEKYKCTERILHTEHAKPAPDF